MKRNNPKSQEEPWITCLEEKLVYSEPSNKWVRLYFDTVRFHDGRIGRYNRVVEGSSGKGVVIIPKDEEGRIGLVRIFRYPINTWQWELPRGFGEKGISSEKNARKELEEETGLTAARLVKVGEIFPNSGVLSTRTDIFLAEVLTASRRPQVDAHESVSVLRFFNREEVDALALTGELMDGFTLSSLALAKTKSLL